MCVNVYFLYLVSSLVLFFVLLHRSSTYIFKGADFAKMWLLEAAPHDGSPFFKLEMKETNKVYNLYKFQLDQPYFFNDLAKSYF